MNRLHIVKTTAALIMFNIKEKVFFWSNLILLVQKAKLNQHHEK